MYIMVQRIISIFMFVFYAYLNWQIYGDNLCMVTWHVPVLFKPSGYPAFTKYVPFSRMVWPHVDKARFVHNLYSTKKKSHLIYRNKRKSVLNYWRPILNLVFCRQFFPTIYFICNNDKNTQILFKIELYILVSRYISSIFVWLFYLGKYR